MTYLGLNEDKPLEQSKLSGVANLLGNIGAGITAFRILPAEFYESLSLDLSMTVRPGVLRADHEAATVNPLDAAAKQQVETACASVINRTSF